SPRPSAQTPRPPRETPSTILPPPPQPKPDALRGAKRLRSLRDDQTLFAFLCVPLVRQAKPGQSCGMKGVHHVSSSFIHVADGAMVRAICASKPPKAKV